MTGRRELLHYVWGFCLLGVFWAIVASRPEAWYQWLWAAVGTLFVVGIVVAVLLEDTIRARRRARARREVARIVRRLSDYGY